MPPTGVNCAVFGGLLSAAAYDKRDDLVIDHSSGTVRVCLLITNVRAVFSYLHNGSCAHLQISLIWEHAVTFLHLPGRSFVTEPFHLASTGASLSLSHDSFNTQTFIHPNEVPELLIQPNPRWTSSNAFATKPSYCRAEYGPTINRWCNYQIPPGQRLPSLYCTF